MESTPLEVRLVRVAASSRHVGAEISGSERLDAERPGEVDSDALIEGHRALVFGTGNSAWASQAELKDGRGLCRDRSAVRDARRCERIPASSVQVRGP